MQADLFVAADSAFSQLVVISSAVPKVMPTRAGVHFQVKLCREVDQCVDEDPSIVTDEQLSAYKLEHLILGA